MCTFICTHTELALTDKQTNKFLTLWKFTQTKREARRQKSRRQSKERQRERAIKSGKQLRYFPFLLSLSLSFSVQFKSHAAPHLVVNATIRVVNNVTVSIPQRDLLEPRDTLQNEPVPNQQQQLLHSMERQRGKGRKTWVFVFIIPFPLTSNETIGSSKQLKSN